MEPRVMFEGIATLDIAGVEHDVYMTAQVEILDDVMVRWFGTVGWIAEGPKKLRHEEIVDGTDVALSDGRHGVIKMAPHQDESGKFEFHGTGLPPGFQPLYQRAILPDEQVTHLMSAELRSTTLPRWRVWSGRVLAVVAFGLMVSAIWVPDSQWKYLVTGLITSVVSIQMVTPAKGRPLPEVKEDDSGRA